jgi:hypothetical protein
MSPPHVCEFDDRCLGCVQRTPPINKKEKMGMESSKVETDFHKMDSVLNIPLALENKGRDQENPLFGSAISLVRRKGDGLRTKELGPSPGGRPPPTHSRGGGMDGGKGHQSRDARRPVFRSRVSAPCAVPEAPRHTPQDPSVPCLSSLCCLPADFVWGSFLFVCLFGLLL